MVHGPTTTVSQNRVRNTGSVLHPDCLLYVVGPDRWGWPKTPAVLSQQQTEQWRCDCHGNPASPSSAGEACRWTEGGAWAGLSLHPDSTLEGYVILQNKHPQRNSLHANSVPTVLFFLSGPVWLANTGLDCLVLGFSFELAQSHMQCFGFVFLVLPMVMYIII